VGTVAEKRRRLLVALLATLTFGTGLAVAGARPVASERRPVTIPFEMSGGVPLLAVSSNGSQRFHATLDFGAHMTLVDEAQFKGAGLDVDAVYARCDARALRPPPPTARLGERLLVLSGRAASVPGRPAQRRQPDAWPDCRIWAPDRAGAEWKVPDGARVGVAVKVGNSAAPMGCQDLARCCVLR
jgi:hypothetical protein